jgi:polyisoprenoid-binding protein YceI
MSVTNQNERLGEAIGGRWRLDPERSTVEFRARKLWGLVPVRGRFRSQHGQLDLSADPAIELTLDAASLETGIAKRDRHLRSPDFFDVDHHPYVRFVSESVDLRDDTLAVRGRLSARGRSIPVSLEATVRRAGEGLEIQAAATAPHRELGMTWSPLGMIRPSSRLFVRAHLIPDV